ncbi:conserved phage protein [Pseudomonas knackmussii B13]|uniref:Conserved phage protein n=1 Tax=Pseudomonas knackmussii (strain DSM 6978 / CCUG 54928 / LMG 23759 / B13) TaxID=1301098 RepID=A0A024HPK4_PSEKB|nr:hypothetical protein [Pseudomonas knackmussii]CDF86358.1 conserved phage protein [Pseudomonas knackmussii B13]
MNARGFDVGANFQRALPGDGILFWFISTPAVQVNGLAVAQMVAPFPTEAEAQRGASLLNERYPGNNCWVGRGEYEPRYATTDRLMRGAQRARADLAGLLAGIERRA